jgi:predicted  nucleic acid-binding Zn-ribbon protein
LKEAVSEKDSLNRELYDRNLTVKSFEKERQAFNARKEFLESSLEKLDVENISITLNVEQCEERFSTFNVAKNMSRPTRRPTIFIRVFI